ncbi:MAG: tetratricopeptide repeat protein [Bdellovibrionota bacterium]
MLGEHFRQLFAIIFLLLLSACATLKNDEKLVDNTPYEKSNRAPASFAPAASVVNDQVGDAFNMRTQADYNYALGEAYSNEGQHQKSIEAFKLTLVYDPESVQVRLRVAAEHIKLGQINQALDKTQEAVKLDPKNIDARLLLAGLYSSLKIYDKAILQYENVLTQKASHPEATLYLAAVYSEIKQQDKAIKLFEALLKNPEYPTPHLLHYYMGRVRLEQKEPKYEKIAEAEFKKTLQIKPDFVDGILTLGNFYSRKKRENEAIKLYDQFQKDRGPNTRVAEVLSQIYIEKEMFDEAYQQFEILEANSDDSLSVKLKMALILIEKKIYDKATQKLEEILLEAPDSDKVRFYLGAVYEETKKDEKAIVQFKKIPPSSSFYSEATIHAAYLMKALNQVDNAIETIEAGIKNKKDVPQMYAMYASLLDDKGDYKKAAQILEKALEQFPEHAQLRFYYGTIQDRLGQKENVITQMKKVIELDPNHVQGLNYLAFTWAEMEQNLPEAEKLARRAADLEPQDGYILDSLGWILYKKGNTQESIKYLEAAVKHQPTVAIIAEHLGDAYMKLTLIDKASRMYQKALDLETDSKKIAELKQKILALEKQKFPNPRMPASQ